MCNTGAQMNTSTDDHKNEVATAWKAILFASLLLLI